MLTYTTSTNKLENSKYKEPQFFNSAKMCVKYAATRSRVCMVSFKNKFRAVHTSELDVNVNVNARMRTEIDRNESEIDLNECEHFLTVGSTLMRVAPYRLFVYRCRYFPFHINKCRILTLTPTKN